MMSKGKFDLGLFGDEGVKTKNLVNHLVNSNFLYRPKKKSISF